MPVKDCGSDIQELEERDKGAPEFAPQIRLEGLPESVSSTRGQRLKAYAGDIVWLHHWTSCMGAVRIIHSGAD